METVLGIDGRAPKGTLAPDGCCPPKLCHIDPCGLACNFVNALPRGPLWDLDKATALSAGCVEPFESDVGPVVRHAIYAAKRLHATLLSALWPALRESDPATAYDTLDEWLDRLGWQECFKCACDCVESVADIPPFEMLMPNGSTICCPSEAPAELDRAVKKGLVLALWRLRMGIVRTVDAVNFVIAPLGCQISADTVDGRPQWMLYPTSDVLAGACAHQCAPSECPTVQAYWELDCDGFGDGRRIYPGMLAAQCILLALMASRDVGVTRVDQLFAGDFYQVFGAAAALEGVTLEPAFLAWEEDFGV